MRNSTRTFWMVLLLPEVLQTSFSLRCGCKCLQSREAAVVSGTVAAQQQSVSQQSC
jgi:hypothetical protein